MNTSDDILTRSTSRPLAFFDKAMALVTEVPAAILVVLETVILFAGVVSRYVFDAP